MGRVIRSTDGAPTLIENLGKADPSLCGEVSDAAQLAKIGRAFEIARKRSPNSSAIEHLTPDSLAKRLLSPVQISAESLKQRQRIIVGAGLNFSDHRSETGFSLSASENDLLLFAKLVSPTGAYQSVPMGYRLGKSEYVGLLDYEVELVLVLLKDIDLKELPNEFVFNNNVAYMVGNDLSDREPIIMDPEHGYVQGKSHPGYLPLGPWMIHGNDMHPTWRKGGTDTLTMSLLVQDKGDYLIRTEQQGLSSQMIFNGYRIAQVLADRYSKNKLTCMRDRFGSMAPLYSENGILPAGSLILTGTPGGTAIKSPDLGDKLGLFVDGGFSLDGARQLFLERQMAASDALGYLQPGDLVYTEISQLGRQRWRVVEGAAQPPLERWPSASCK
ncbi:fumarylacetoacetate hydrolase family protein [Corallincola platygyrae]|uniref:Fumarylacetoacetate hydrolase family protein n=1 Tax=Corallincola platygyrae TaxID=1193278 RepID=A0ABW4XSD1_9GAMM